MANIADFFQPVVAKVNLFKIQQHLEAFNFHQFVIVFI